MAKAMQGGACFCLQFFSRRQLFSFLENILNYIIITTTALWLYLVVYSVVYMLLVFSFHFFSLGQSARRRRCGPRFALSSN